MACPGGNRGVLALDIPKVDIPLGQLADNDVMKRLEPCPIVGLQRNFRIDRFPLDRCRASLEIKSRSQFLERLVDCIVDLLPVNSRNDVERGHAERLLSARDSGQ